MSKPDIELLIDNHHGVYIPQLFAEQCLDLRRWFGVTKEDKSILLAGPDHELYWDVWNDVEMNAEHKKTGATLYHDGDLWAIYPGAIISMDDLRDAIDGAVERFQSGHNATINHATYDLHEGTNHSGKSFSELIDNLRDAIDKIDINLPRYVWSDCGGFEEIDIDLHDAILQELDPELRPYI